MLVDGVSCYRINWRFLFLSLRQSTSENTLFIKVLVERLTCGEIIPWMGGKLNFSTKINWESKY